MGEAVLMSVQPFWCWKIAMLLKKVELRKGKPKLTAPFKCYIYCTLSGSNRLFKEALQGDIAAWNRGKWGERKGMVIGEFTCSAVEAVTVDNGKTISQFSCVSLRDMWEYARPKSMFDLFGWHISDLVIYDKPKALSEFGLKRPPQSWCYVKEIAA